MISLADAAVDDLPTHAPAQHLRWADDSGASVAFHLSDGDGIACVTPFFVPPDEPLSRWRVMTTGPAPDPRCEHCGGADCDILDAAGEMVTRAAVQWLHFVPFHAWLEEPRELELEVVAFARQAAFFDTPEAFEEGQREMWGEPAECKGEPVPGSIALVRAWLVGRPAVLPPAAW
jgi:hypothetical protein